MKVVIQQVDLDTALTAFVLGVCPVDEILVTKGDAPPSDLADPDVLCIEAGGSGQVEHNNFDHHNTARPLPPACHQAMNVTGRDEPMLHRLVDYVTAIDVADRSAFGPSPGFPTLSDVFSGMRLSEKSPVAQLRAGLQILSTVCTEKLDPFGRMPRRPEWLVWIQAKHQENENLQMAAEQAELFCTHSGIQAGFLQTTYIGALRVLYGLGCSFAIAYAPSFGDPPIRKYTIGGQALRVDHLLPFLNTADPGWGGPAHGTIIGSPRTGCHLIPETVKHIVEEYC